ncbi:hypothetical protein IJF81_03780 [bacterium]|nr:hypothetical protein [bacterium]
MKKILASLLVLSFVITPSFAAQNYSYRIVSPRGNITRDVTVKTQNFDFLQGSNDIQQHFTIKGSPTKTGSPYTITTIDRQVPDNDLQESVEQKDTMIIYKSGKKFSWRDASAMTGAAAAIGTIAALDPYIVKINGKTYIMVRGNNKNFVKQNILGLNDDYKNLFRSLKECDLDNNGIVSGAELKQSNVRLALFQGKTVYFADKSKDYNVENIKAIPFNKMTSQIPESLRQINRNSNIQINKPGIYGSFEVILNNGKTAKGLVEFYSKVTINNMVKEGNK